MITKRPAADRGRTKIGWLESWHSFSFGDYYDPSQMGFGTLRVINDDVIGAGQGFGAHPHRDMEIVTYVVNGAVAHQDSMGNKSVIRAGEVQRMTAGKGVAHSEFNDSSTEPLHLLQIWIQPRTRGLTPGYEERALNNLPGDDRLRLIAAPGGEEGAMDIHQECKIYSSKVGAGETASLNLAKGAKAWVQLVKGDVTLNGNDTLATGDGAAIEGVDSLSWNAKAPSELLVFEMTA